MKSSRRIPAQGAHINHSSAELDKSTSGSKINNLCYPHFAGLDVPFDRQVQIGNVMKDEVD